MISKHKRNEKRNFGLQKIRAREIEKTKKEEDKTLDQALKETFPASDPISNY